MSPEDLTLTREQIQAIVNIHRAKPREVVVTTLRTQLEGGRWDHEAIEKVIGDLDSYL